MVLVGKKIMKKSFVVLALVLFSLTVSAQSNKPLSVYSQYAYEWSNYRGSDGSAFNEKRLLLSNVPLVKPFGNGSHSLALGVYNGNSGHVKNAILTVTLPSNVTVANYRAGKYTWSKSGQSLTYTFADLEDNDGTVTGAQLSLKFSSRGSYQFRYTIKEANVPDSNGSFTIVLK